LQEEVSVNFGGSFVHCAEHPRDAHDRTSGVGAPEVAPGVQPEQQVWQLSSTTATFFNKTPTLRRGFKIQIHLPKIKIIF
jgi:hypothetical protein